MRIDFLGLEAFLSIADRGSFHLAAAHLNLSQTALSHRMKKLEDDLGVKLLARTTRQVALTPAGQDLLPKARRMMDEISASFAALRQQGKERQERLTVGCLPTIADPLPAARASGVPDGLAGADRAGARQLGDARSPSMSRPAGPNSASRSSRPTAGTWRSRLCSRSLSSRSARRSHPLAGRLGSTGRPGRHSAGARQRPDRQSRLDRRRTGRRREQMTWRYECQHVATAVSLVAAGLGSPCCRGWRSRGGTPGSWR